MKKMFDNQDIGNRNKLSWNTEIFEFVGIDIDEGYVILRYKSK